MVGKHTAMSDNEAAMSGNGLVSADGGAEAELAEIVQMGPGSPLGAAAARAATKVLGQPPGDVTVHIGPEAERFAAQHQARAVTVGSHIAFGAGQYRPGTREGDELLAHELAHVIQMRGAIAQLANAASV
jgi:hypothetical protein